MCIGPLLCNAQQLWTRATHEADNFTVRLEESSRNHARCLLQNNTLFAVDGGKEEEEEEEEEEARTTAPAFSST